MLWPELQERRMSKKRKRNPLGLYFWPLAVSSFWIVEHHQAPPHLCGLGGIRSWSWGGMKPNLPSLRGLRRGRLQGGKPCKFSEIRPKSIHGQGHSRVVTMRPSSHWLLGNLASLFYHAWAPSHPQTATSWEALVSISVPISSTHRYWAMVEEVTWPLPVDQMPAATRSWL